MSTATVYGRIAYEGFAKAMGAKLGLSVTIDAGVNACIDDQGTILLPDMCKHQTAAEFALTCGVIVHELSHQFYGSHRLIDPNRSPLEHDCLNAVLDVADETWVSEWFARGQNRRPGDLLDLANRDAVVRQQAPLMDWNNPATHAWKVLCVGILKSRGVRVRRFSRLVRYTVQEAAVKGVDAAACFRLLRRAVLAKRQDPTPTPKRFAKLLKLAQELAKLLAPFAEGTQGTSLLPLGDALGRGSESPRERVAGSYEGAVMADVPSGSGCGDVPSGSGCGDVFDEQSFALLSPSVAAIAQRIAIEGEGAAACVGLSTGSRLGEAHRLMTDGLCLARWEESEHAEGVSVSVLLDCSASMHQQLAACAGIARAFSLGMRQAGAVQSLAFGSNVQESDDFRCVAEMGGTSTDLALNKAADWLAQRSGQRWIVLVTDGEPNDQEAADAACHAAAAAGIRILAIGLDCTISMPHAWCVTASCPAHLAIELQAAAQQIWEG